MQELYSLKDLELQTGLPFIDQPLNSLFGGYLDRLKVASLYVAEDNDGYTAHLLLAVKQDLLLSLQGSFSFGIVVDDPEDWPMILCEIVIGTDSQSLSLQHFPLRIGLPIPQLRPVAVEEQAEVLDTFSFEIEGGFSVASDLSVSATLDAFSIPPFEIVDTGLVLALDDCRLIIAEEDIDQALTELGFTESFRGLHAQSALFRWDIPLQIQGREVPGIDALLENVAIGSEGVSLKGTLSWPVVIEDGDFDSNQTELLGYLADPEWTCALASLQVELRANVPVGLGAAGYLRVPFLETILALELTALAATETHPNRLAIALSNIDDTPLRVPLGHDDYRLELQRLNLTSELATNIEAIEAIDLTGYVKLELALPGLALNIDETTFSLAYLPQKTLLELGLGEVEVPDIGTLRNAHFHLEVGHSDTGHVVEKFSLLGTVVWSDLKAQVDLSPVPDAFPLPPDGAELTLEVSWDGSQMKFRLKGQMEDVDSLWRFLPAPQRPQVAEAEVTIDLSRDASRFRGELGVELRLRLPDGLLTAIPENVVHLEAGDEEGWTQAAFLLQADAGDSTKAQLHAELSPPFRLGFGLPGLPLPEPPLEVTIKTLHLTLNSDQDANTGAFTFKGGLVLRPLLPGPGMAPPALLQPMERLLASLEVQELAAEVDLTVGYGESGFHATLDAEFSEATIELDLFDMLASTVSPAAGVSPGGNEIDLDLDVSLSLASLKLSLGSAPGHPEDSSEGLPMAMALGAMLGFAGQSVEFSFALSGKELSCGLVELPIPIAIPELPVRREHLDELRGADGRWDPGQWQVPLEPALADELEAASQAVDAALQRLQALPTSDASRQQAREAFELEHRVLPRLRRRLLELSARKFLIEAVLAIHHALGELSGEQAQNSFQALTEQYQELTDNTLGLLHGDTGVQFVIRNLRFVLPFDDPANVRVEGGAALDGFDPDGSLAGLNGLGFTAGISPEAIYFAIDGDDNAIELPDFGRYPGNRVRVGRLAIGYGYTKNSLKVDFEGELELSPQLIEDVDTSARAGMGLRLARNNRLRFKLDLIPISLGEINFVLPLPAFDIDLRSDIPPTAAGTEGCAPAWDGLQLIIPGALRADFKGAAFSPFFGPLPSPNFQIGYDIELGNQEAGATYVCDDYRYIMPVAGTLPLPFLADTVPFFDRLCGEIRIAGFGVGMDLARPFPRPGPLLVLELLGFLSDPSLPIDPASELAGLVSAELRHARIRLPPAVAAMFPGQEEFLTRDYQARIDITTLITLAQNLVATVSELSAQLAEAGEDFSEAVEAIIQNPPRPEIGDLLDALPAQLRRIELEGAFGGFEANAVFLLIGPGEMRDALAPKAPSHEPPTTHWKTVVHDTFDHAPLEHWRVVDYGLKGGSGDWRISSGKLLQAANVGDNSPARYGTMLIRETLPLSDLRIQVQLTAKDNDGMGVIFFYENERTFHRFRMTSEQGRWELVRIRRGKVQSLHRSEDVFSPGTPYRVRIEARVLPPSEKLGPLLPSLRQRLPRRGKVRARCQIDIWVNDTLWCSVDGGTVADEGGLVGLDSWWNQGVVYDEFRVEEATRSAAMKNPADSAAAPMTLPPEITDRLSFVTGQEGSVPFLRAGGPPWQPQDLAGFGAEDLRAALPDEDAAAVAVAARVRIFTDQVYRMLGVMRSDGSFRLQASAGAGPLRLEIAGFTAPLMLDLHSRLLLEGRYAGIESWARVTAELSGEWTLFGPPSVLAADKPLPPGFSLPGVPLRPGDGTKNPPLARLRLGTPSDAAHLQLDSRGRFALLGDGELSLFDDAVVVTGSIDLSEQRATIQGELSFAPPIKVGGGVKAMELTLQGGGELGPGPHFLLRGQGALKLLGMPFSEAGGEISEQGLLLQARLDSPASTWSIKGFELARPHMALSGRVDFSRTVPTIELEGEGGFEWHDLVIEGQCHVHAGQDGWCLGAAGRLEWQGLDWLEAAAELCGNRLRVRGESRFAAELTPSQLPGGLNVAGLYLSGSIAGEFELRPSRSLASCRLEVQWTLAVRLPDGEPGQSLPIASQRVQENLPTISGPNRILLTLLEISGIRLLPLDDVSIPIPTLGDPTPYCTQIDWPFLHECDESDGPPPPLFSIPGVGIDALSLGELTQIANVGIQISVQWKDGRLGLKIGNQFFAFTDLLPPLGNE